MSDWHTNAHLFRNHISLMMMWLAAHLYTKWNGFCLVLVTGWRTTYPVFWMKARMNNPIHILQKCQVVKGSYWTDAFVSALAATSTEFKKDFKKYLFPNWWCHELILFNNIFPGSYFNQYRNIPGTGYQIPSHLDLAEKCPQESLHPPQTGLGPQCSLLWSLDTCKPLHSQLSSHTGASLYDNDWQANNASETIMIGTYSNPASLILTMWNAL